MTPLGLMLRRAMDRKSREIGHRYTYRALEADSHVEHSHINRIVHGGRKTTRPTVKALAKALEPYLPLNKALLAAGLAPDGDDSDSDDAYAEYMDRGEFPFVEEVHAGPGGILRQQEFWPDEVIERGTLRPFTVRGDCMIPSVYPGDELIVDTEAHAEDRDLVLVETDDGLQVRRFVDGEYICENPDPSQVVMPPVPNSPVFVVVKHSRGRRRIRGSC
jgi:hypothetical protein